MKREAIPYIINICIQRGIGVLLYLLGAGWIMNERAAVYFICYVGAAVISLAIMMFVNAETLKQRNKKKTDSPMWDKVLLGLFWLLAYFVIYYIAGIESRNATALLDGPFWLGIALNIIAFIITLWALMVNPFLESTARIQEERGQTVCQKGPYRIVRHPTYLGLLIWCVAISLVFRTWGVILCSIVIAILVIVRTYLEDRMLKDHLAGYSAYAAKTKYRLIPYVW